LSLNVDVGLQYLSAWLGGNGCVPIYNLMEDAATAEICRAQLWQWMRHGSRLEDGRVVTPELVGGMVHQHVEKLSKDLPEAQLSTAARLLDEMVNAVEFPQFLTLRAYDHLA
jgi:malate synthase